jgi:hypothetical protein
MAAELRGGDCAERYAAGEHGDQDELSDRRTPLALRAGRRGWIASVARNRLPVMAIGTKVSDSTVRNSDSCSAEKKLMRLTITPRGSAEGAEAMNPRTTTSAIRTQRRGRGSRAASAGLCSVRGSASPALKARRGQSCGSGAAMSGADEIHREQFPVCALANTRSCPRNVYASRAPLAAIRGTARAKANPRNA